MTWGSIPNIVSGVIQPTASSGTGIINFDAYYALLPPVVSIQAVHSSNILVHVTSYIDSGSANYWTGFNYEWSGGQPTYITWMAIL